MRRFSIAIFSKYVFREIESTVCDAPDDLYLLVLVCTVVFTVQINGGMATPLTHTYLLTLKLYPTNGEGAMHPAFA